MADSREQQFQTDIINAMLTKGWVTGPASGYDRTAALYSEDVLAFFKTAYPEPEQRGQTYFQSPACPLLSKNQKCSLQCSLYKPASTSGAKIFNFTKKRQSK